MVKGSSLTGFSLRQKEATFLTGRNPEEDEDVPEVVVEGVSKVDESNTKRVLSLSTRRRSMADAHRKSEMDFFCGKNLRAN